ncbi:hypothetical protein BDB00DRAFT_852929 [Zychaea mexicana]|uniref:uncharacterized protein n=1 Tax=Zychaea mexicana TaxID=64656 RepID=UPI0022FEA9D3|nr:uncharacterized protein BDB00DRAFT_852929 [Zychaea mexicana]KAI9484862.1 hypothetical protein BDB00DRAFT_852929 [Zychaea mexicana]
MSIKKTVWSTTRTACILMTNLLYQTSSSNCCYAATTATRWRQRVLHGLVSLLLIHSLQVDEYENKQRITNYKITTHRSIRFVLDAK